MGEHDEHIAFEMGYNKGFKDGIKGSIPKSDYENRLKADMVDMLEDLRLDFQEAELAGVLDNRELIFADEVDDLVQQKINSLKEDKNEN